MASTKKYEKGLVSVIILHYNQPSFLPIAIMSILEQDYESIEIIVADDHSPQFSESETKKFIDKNRRKNIRCYMIHVNEANLGTVKNINNAISLSNGEYIKIFAGDDALHNSKVLSKQVQGLIETGTLINTGYLQQCDAELNPCKDQSAENNKRYLRTVLEMPFQEREQFIYRHNLFPYATQSMLFKREFFEFHGLYNEKYRLIEDTPMMWKILDTETEVSLTRDYVIKHRADVGVTQKKGNNPKSKVYYNDCITMLEDKMLRNRNTLIKLDCKAQMDLFKFRMSDQASLSNVQKIKGYIYLIPSVVTYAILHPIRFLRRFI